MKTIFFLLLFSSVIFSQWGSTFNKPMSVRTPLEDIPSAEVHKSNLYELHYQAIRSQNSGLHDLNSSSKNLKMCIDALDKKFPIQNQLLNISEKSNSKKNPTLAILYSMLIPGMGELYANAYNSGMYFTITDGILWGVFAGFNIYGKWKEDNYKSFAQVKGGINTDGKDSDFYATIGIYISIDEYNRVKELNREFYNVYNPATHYWNWSSDNQRKEYREMWLSSEQAYNNVRFAVGALILNRIISAINAVRLVSAYNKNISSELSWNVNFDVLNNPNLPSTISLNFVKSF